MNKRLRYFTFQMVFTMVLFIVIDISHISHISPFRALAVIVLLIALTLSNYNEGNEVG